MNYLPIKLSAGSALVPKKDLAYSSQYPELSEKT
jgi:hypothetical protein